MHTMLYYKLFYDLVFDGYIILLEVTLQFGNEYPLCCGPAIFISSLLCAHSLLQCTLPFSSHVSFPG